MPAWYQVSVTDEEILAQPCSACLQPPGVMCVYLTEVRSHTMYGEQRYALGTGRPVIAHRPGEPMTTLHSARRRKAREKKAQALAAVQRRAALIQRRVAAAEVLEQPARGLLRSLAALNAYDPREYAQLRDWLRAYGEILWDS
jgi:hypothetical protein